MCQYMSLHCGVYTVYNVAVPPRGVYIVWLPVESRSVHMGSTTRPGAGHVSHRRPGEMRGGGGGAHLSTPYTGRP